MINPQVVETLRIKIDDLNRRFADIAEDEQLRGDMLDAETEIAHVLTTLIRLGEDARAFRDGTKEQQARLKARADRFERRIEYARELMLAILEAANLRKWELPEATVFVRSNPPQIVGEVDGNRLPDDLVEIVRKPDKARIKEALKEGRALEGLALSNQPPSVVVTIR